MEEVLRSGWITTGKKVKLFEKKIAEYVKTKSAVCLNSATAALEMCLRILDIGPGDEVITSAYTYTASCSVIKHVGATPVLIDTAKDSFYMNLESLENSITRKTKAIIAVDIAGRMCDYDKLLKIVKNKKYLFTPKNERQKAFGRILVIADAAHSFGASLCLKNSTWKKSGNVADFTAFSFHAVKNITTAEGGALTWRQTPKLNSKELYRDLMLLSLHGQSKDALAKANSDNWEYDIENFGYKCNMTDVSAAIGLSQLERYEKTLEKRKKIIKKYDNFLEKFNVKVFTHFSKNFISSGHLYLVNLIGKSEIFRNALIEKMAKLGVSMNVHYKPLPMFTAYKNLGFNIKNYSNAFNVYKNEITFPLHTLLTENDIEYVLQMFDRSFRG